MEEARVSAQGGTSNPLDTILAAITSSQRETRELRAELRAAQEEAAERAARKSEKPYHFQKKAHEDQAFFNESVMDHILEAESQLSRAARLVADGPAKVALEKAKQSLKLGKDALSHRQKLIKLADRSDFGWAVVNEYEADALAVDSDDEKRLDRAERAAERRANAKKRKSEDAERVKKMEHEAQDRAKAAARWSGAGVVAGAGALGKPALPRGSGPVVCYGCGEAGHFKRECPKKSVVAYPLVVEHSGGICGDTSALGVGGSAAPDQEAAHGLSPVVLQDGLSLEGSHTVELSPEAGTDGDELACTQRCWEYEEVKKNSMAVKGRLRQHVEYWVEELHATQWIIDMIRDGYMLPFHVEPPAYRRGNKNTAYANSVFVCKAVADLVGGGFVEEVTEQPFICSPVSVVENSAGKKRLVVNLRHVNQYLLKRKFKYEDLRIAMMLFSQGELMFSFDLKSGYHHVDIARHHRKYLGFEWERQFYVFTVLPFGLASAPYVFTKLLRPLVKLWRSRGLKCLMYLDDGIVAVKGKESAEKASMWVRGSLERAGFVMNVDKSVWTPSHRVMWLGFNIDLLDGYVSVPREKVDMLVALLRVALLSSWLRAKQIASIVGRIISMGIALGPVSRFMTRNLYAVLESRYAWCDVLEVSPQARAELEFWVDCLHCYNSQPIWHSPSAVRVVYSDASDTGYGGYTVEHGMHVAHGNWLPEEAVKSSTWRELVAVSRVLDSIAPKLRNVRVRWFSDNQNVVRIIQVGSRKAHLQEQAMRVFETCIAYQIRLEPEWLPREENELADFISRIIDYDDWQVDPECFYVLDGIWGPHSIDRFADNYNSQLPRFNSRFACPGTEAVDAFTVDWGGGENNWWCPPPSLVDCILFDQRGLVSAGGRIVFYSTSVVLCLPGADLEAAGVWSRLADLKDPELQWLAREVPDTLLSGKADSTVRKYIGAFQRWKLWAEARLGVPSFPAQEAHIVLYLQHLSQSVQSKSAIEEAVNALSWLHQVSGLPPVSSLPLVQAALAGHRRLLAQPKVRKEPVTAEMLKAMVVAAGPEPSLSEVRLLAICLVGFAGFMRCEELLKLECADVKFKEEGMVLSIRSSKTDQFREGDSLLVGRTGAITCPVQMMERYFRMGHLNGESHDRVFRAIVNSKGGEMLRKSGGLSYSRLRELLLAKIAMLGMDPLQFGMHSLRAGGATAAANAGVPDRLFKRHGRWRSESAKDGYVKDSAGSRLSVSKSLGI
ncbi:hypothetical protein EMCRGX_G032089 [Ephydatia muelleri]|eukprot:Em0001g905a